MNYLLDTNICVYFMRGKRNVAAKISEIGQEHFFISEMTLGELLYGAQCSDRPSENIRAVHVFCQYVTILPTANIWNEFAVQKAFLRKKGQLIEDAWHHLLSPDYPTCILSRHSGHLQDEARCLPPGHSGRDSKRLYLPRLANIPSGRECTYTRI